ncbi:MAG: hypothetical protein HYV63_12760 [Candidatus Schekmanbacteria bacterium]|nr:hypothetical protein [Candidatus Schekmanbacteria bacterium]
MKKAILHRRSSLFYQTANGAHVGDVLINLIHTAKLGGSTPSTTWWRRSAPPSPPAPNAGCPGVMPKR